MQEPVPRPYLDASELPFFQGQRKRLMPTVSSTLKAQRRAPQAGGAERAQRALHHLIELDQPESMKGSTLCRLSRVEAAAHEGLITAGVASLGPRGTAHTSEQSHPCILHPLNWASPSNPIQGQGLPYLLHGFWLRGRDTARSVIILPAWTRRMLWKGKTEHVIPRNGPRPIWWLPRPNQKQSRP